MGRARLAAGVAAAIVFGMLTAAPAAHATDPCKPVHDPNPCEGGTPSPMVYSTTVGARAEMHVERSNTTRSANVINFLSHVEDTADDGLDAHLWVSYVRIGADGTRSPVEEVLATASGLGTMEFFGWSAQGEDFVFRVCNGPGVSLCDDWR